MIDIKARKISRQFVELNIETASVKESIGVLDKEEMYYLCLDLNDQLNELVELQKTMSDD